MRQLLWFATVSMLVVAGQPTAGAQTPSGTLPQVGTLPRHPADSVAALGTRILPGTIGGDQRGTLGGTLIAVHERKELWQLYPTTAFVSTIGPTAIAIRDMATLAIKRTVEVPVPLQRGSFSGTGGDWFHAIDGGRRIFFLSTFTTAGTSRWSVVEVNMETLAVREMPLSAPANVGGGAVQGIKPAAMEYDPFSDRVILMYGGLAIGAGAFLTWLLPLDLKSGTQAGNRLVRTCNGSQTPADVGSTMQYAAIITEPYVYYTCQRAGSIGGVVRIPRRELLDPLSSEDIVSGPAYLETSLADPESGRIFLATIASEIWAFDIQKMAFVGVVAGTGDGGALRPHTGFGVDPRTGRLFVLTPALGFGFAEGRFSPIPQARVFKGMSAEGQERIISDASTGRVFVLTGWGAGAGARASAYKIYDAGRAPTPPPPPDPDRNTTDVAEQPGVTESRYFANGNGYGVRSLLAKGVSAVPPQPTTGENAPLAEIIANRINSKCGFTDRELVVGRVANAEYDTGSTSARAVGIDIDERTKLDLARLSRCDVAAPDMAAVFTGIFSTMPPPAAEKCQDAATGLNDSSQNTEGTGVYNEDGRSCDSGVHWRTQPASCSSSAGGVSESQSPSRNEAPSSGTVRCPEPGGDLTATGVGYLTGAVAVGKAETTTTITKGSQGVESTVRSLAQNIDITEHIRIGEVSAIAVSRANGRPSKAPMSTYEFSIKGLTLTVGGQKTVLCDEFRRVVGDVAKASGQEVDEKKNCDIESATRTLNTALAGRAEFRISNGLDETLLDGTERGALTAVQKSVARQASDSALVGDKTNEIPGLELTVYNDNKPFGRARQIFQFAGVATAATYNIALLPTGLGFDDDPGSFDESDFDPAGGFGDAFLGSMGGMPNVLPPTSDIADTSDDDDGAGGFAGAVRALARGIRMFFTNPRHALLLLTAWALFSLPPVLARRRQLLALARSE